MHYANTYVIKAATSSILNLFIYAAHVSSLIV